MRNSSNSTQQALTHLDDTGKFIMRRNQDGCNGARSLGNQNFDNNQTDLPESGGGTGIHSPGVTMLTRTDLSERTG